MRTARCVLSVLAASIGLLAVGPLAGAQAAGTASLTGTVISAKTGEKLQGIDVTAENEAGSEFGAVTTNAEGKYTIPALSEGTYRVTFSDSTAVYLFQQREGVFLKEGEPTPVNPSLVTAATISGTVTNASGGALAGVEVTARSTSGEEHSSSTEANGRYTIGELAPGSYTVEFSASGFESQSTSVALAEGASPEVSAALREKGKISGRVTDAYTHAGLAKIDVFASSTTGGGDATTNANGEYTITGLAPGSYKLEYFWEFSAAEDKDFEHAPRFIPKYITQFYNGQLSEATANAVGVSEGGLTPGINVAMVPSLPFNTAAPAISGTATVGSLLTCSSGSWTGEPELKLSMGWPLTTPFGYQWLRDGAPIAGATLPGYLVQTADLGHGLICQVAATNNAGSAIARSSTFPVANPVPVLRISTSRLSVSKNAIKLSIACASASCIGAIKLVQTTVVKHKKGKKTVSKKTMLVLATGTYSLAAGKTGTSTLRLSGAGKKKLAGARRHRLSPKLIVSVKGGRPIEKTVQLSMAKEKKKK